MDQKKLEQVRKDTEEVQKILMGERKLSPMEKTHGKLVERRCEAYYDVNVYEDGFEDYIYIGD